MELEYLVAVAPNKAVRAKSDSAVGKTPYAIPDDPANRRKEQVRAAARKHREKRRAMGDREFRCVLRAMEVAGWENWVEEEGHDPIEVLREALMFGMKFRMRMGARRGK